MMVSLWRHIRSNVVGYLALFVALGGSSYAAVNLPRNSVKAKQIAPNSVGSSELKYNSVTSAEVKKLHLNDFAPGELARLSSKGERGTQGSEGAVGATGPPGPSGVAGTALAFAEVRGCPPPPPQSTDLCATPTPDVEVLAGARNVLSVVRGHFLGVDPRPGFYCFDLTDGITPTVVVATPDLTSAKPLLWMQGTFQFTGDPQDPGLIDSYCPPDHHDALVTAYDYAPNSPDFGDVNFFVEFNSGIP
jgi:hypothetical protein